MPQDFIQAARRLLKTPGFAIVAMLTLALGLGANIAVFSMLNEFMLRPLKVPHPEQLVFLMQKNKDFELPYGISYSDYVDMRDALTKPAESSESTAARFSDLIAYSMFPVHVSEGSQMPERAWAEAVSGNYFDMVGIHPSLGRFFLEQEGKVAGTDPIAVLTHAFWTERFHADPRVIGTSVTINGEPFTIVGVAPKGFGGTDAMTRVHLFVPLTMWDVLQPNHEGALEQRGNSMLMLMGRLRPGVSLDEARAAASTVHARLVNDYPNEHAPTTLLLTPEQKSRPSPYVSKYAPAALAALTLLATLVLCVAMANIANLLYARSAEAGHTLAIRSALGATRWRLIRYLLCESLLLAAGAGLLGWYVNAGFGVLLQNVTVSAANPPTVEPSPDWRPVVYTAAVALLAGLITGIFPALRATRRDMIPALNESTRSYVSTRHPLRSILVAGQVAISCIVLVCAGMAVNSLYLLAHVDLGFRPDNVLLATFDLELQRYDKEQAKLFQKNLLDEVRTLPGVTSAGLTRAVPFDTSIGLRGDIGAEGQAALKPDESYFVACVSATPGYIETAGISLRKGRDFTKFDTDETPPVAIINEAVAQHFWPGEDPIGKHLTFWNGNRIVEVVGTIGSGRYYMMSDSNRPLILVPLTQEFSSNVSLALHASGDPMRLAEPVREIAHRLDPDLPVFNIRTLSEQVNGSALGLMPLRFGAIIAATQGAMVLLLAIMGLYGLVSFAVACRTREIGIRMALGATRNDIIRLITRPSLVLTAIGLCVGLGLAFLATRPLPMLLYGTHPNDLLVFGVVAAVICLVTVVAAWMPARRATKIDPVESLRAE